MERAKKFGTFGGVFTPSLLTILGVIMYLRLGWIVGQAGLYYVVGIILIAHVISVTTGLSLSSIATDKKIKGGGIYYMLSRSLGLPIGGAIGATIFLATALSISLYLVGFSESFLAVDAIRDFLGLEQTIDSYRIVATVVIAALTIIAFISTSLAIKIQYFVLTAIVLSLASIFAGLFMNTGLSPAVPSLSPATTSPSPDILFAIFFPAVTGFTVGVAMSGDLKDPKRSIPKGTLIAIFTGMIIYLSMAIGFALFVDRELLLNDSAFLLKISWIPLLVIAGIWGATLSSALGGILGGPRIVQALAKDKLAPRLLSKGFGINNEPRAAILLTFLIAQAGILIGDLNTIARVVSMFFIAAYGFINLAFALESWASTDFRPSFKVPVWVGWLGFGASLMVMMQIDFIAMLVAFILIWLTWFMMKKRRQELEPGDVWQSVWSNVVRHSLHKMDEKGIEERNWKPNIILFSGNPQTRPHLVELGKELITDHGLLTIINLQKHNQEDTARSRFRQSKFTPESHTHKGIFTREYYCHDFYQGIENLAETYGFAGVEPNTVLMGWSRRTSDPVRFAKLLMHIIRLDLNLLLMDYDEEKGFGKRKTIDIWWRGSGNNGNLAIHLVKFLWLSAGWKDSKTRLMIENPINEERENIYNFAREVLDNLRVNAEIFIINNEVDKKPFYDIIRAESTESDIIFLGMPDIEPGLEEEFLEQTNQLCNDLGSVVLIKASTQFKRLNIGLKHKTSVAPRLFERTDDTLESQLNWPRSKEVAEALQEFHAKSAELNREMISKTFGKALSQYAEILNSSLNRVNATFSIIEKKLTHKNSGNDKSDPDLILFKLSSNSFTRYEQILSQLRDETIPEQSKGFRMYFSKLQDRYTEILSSLPEYISAPIEHYELAARKDDSSLMRFYKWRKRTLRRGHPSQRVKFRKLVTQLYPHTWNSIRNKSWQRFSTLSLEYLKEEQRAFKQFRDSLHSIQNAHAKGTFSMELLKAEQENVARVFMSLNRYLHDAAKNLSGIADVEQNKSIMVLSARMDALNANSRPGKLKPENRFKKHHVRQMDTFAAIWQHNQTLQINHNYLEVTLSAIDYKAWYFSTKATTEIRQLLRGDNPVSATELPLQIQQFITLARERLQNNQSLPKPDFTKQSGTDLHRKIKDIEDFLMEKLSSALSRIPATTELIREHSAQDITFLKQSSPDTRNVEVSRLIHFIIQSDLITPLQQNLRDFADKLNGYELELEEITRLIQISLTSDKEDTLALPGEDFFSQQAQRAIEQEENIHKLSRTTEDKIQNALNKTSQQLSLPVFLKTAENLKLFVKTKEAEQQKSAWWKTRLTSAREFLRRYLVMIWFDRSRRMVYAYQTKVRQEGDLFTVSALHQLNEQSSVRDHIFNQIPPYYQQLFMRKNNYFMDFWQGKPAELEEAQQTIARHEKGFNGAMLIRGEHNSGKTFMTNFIAHKFLANKSVYTIQPPFAGSVSAADFLRSFQKATESYVSAEKTLKTLPDKSVIIIEDLELWWEKSTKGMAVIRYIEELIEKFGDKILFILTVNLHAFNSINRLTNLNTLLISTIDCYPFHAEELKNIILQRHKSGNLKFVYKGIREEEMRSWDYARLFNTYFNFTRGNVGLSLQTWMASIKEVKDDTIYIKAPRRADTTVLNQLSAQNLVFLVQFILHKRLNIDKIQRILLLGKSEAQQKVVQLKRAALVIEPNPGIFMLNPNLHTFIRERLIEKELL